MFDGFADDLVEERGIRPLIIVGASKIDDLLQEILKQYLLPKIAKPKEKDELLEGDRPLSTFSARIKMCYRLGLIDNTLYEAIEKFGSLRNPGAHAIAFDHTKSPHRDHISELRKALLRRESFSWTREKYFRTDQLTTVEEIQCILLTLCVLLEAIRETVTTTSGIENAIRIAKR